MVRPTICDRIVAAIAWYYAKYQILVFGGIGAAMVIFFHILFWCGVPRMK